MLKYLYEKVTMFQTNDMTKYGDAVQYVIGFSLIVC